MSRHHLIAALLLTTLLLLGCRGHGYQKLKAANPERHSWNYYPTRNIYHCKLHHHYWTRSAESGGWVHTEALPPHITLDDGAPDAFIVKDASGEPYHGNLQHIERYRKGTGK